MPSKLARLLGRRDEVRLHCGERDAALLLCRPAHCHAIEADDATNQRLSVALDGRKVYIRLRFEPQLAVAILRRRHS